MKYKWKDGRHIKNSKGKAQIAGEMCEQLSESVGLTNKTFLDANRESNAPLHDSFEWNDGIAAEGFRLSQARDIINSIVIVQPETSEEESKVRAFHVVVNDESNEREYMPLEIIQKSDNYTNQMLDQAFNDYKVYRNKYKTLKELTGIWDSADMIFANFDLGNNGNDDEETEE